MADQKKKGGKEKVGKGKGDRSAKGSGGGKGGGGKKHKAAFIKQIRGDSEVNESSAPDQRGQAQGPGGKKGFDRRNQKGGQADKQQGGKGEKGAKKTRFTEHVAPEAAMALVDTGHLCRGSLRINAKKRQEAYVKVEGVPHDVWIDGDVNRNRAFSKDIVAIRLLPSSEWRSRTGNSGGGEFELPKNPYHEDPSEEETPEELMLFAKQGTIQAQAVVVSILESRHQTFQIGALVPANGEAVRPAGREGIGCFSTFHSFVFNLHTSACLYGSHK